jgi:hypothetical protein
MRDTTGRRTRSRDADAEHAGLDRRTAASCRCFGRIGGFSYEGCTTDSPEFITGYERMLGPYAELARADRTPTFGDPRTPMAPRSLSSTAALMTATEPVVRRGRAPARPGLVGRVRRSNGAGRAFTERSYKHSHSIRTSAPVEGTRARRQSWQKTFRSEGFIASGRGEWALSRSAQAVVMNRLTNVGTVLGAIEYVRG